jgi:hypothetical protein
MVLAHSIAGALPQFYIGHSLLNIGYSAEPLGVLALGSGQRLKPKNKMSNIQQGMSNVEVRSNEAGARFGKRPAFAAYLCPNETNGAGPKASGNFGRSC